MRIVLRPRGRGNLHPMVLELDGKHAPLPVEVYVGMVVTFGGFVFRVAKVLP